MLNGLHALVADQSAGLRVEDLSSPTAPIQVGAYDHLGDAYWRIGRKLEAKYQWQQSLSLKPESDQVVELEKKIKTGLADAPETKAADRTGDASQKLQR